MDVRDGGTRFCRFNRGIRDLFGSDRNVWAFAGGISCSRNRAGQDDVVIHSDRLPFSLAWLAVGQIFCRLSAISLAIVTKNRT